MERDLCMGIFCGECTVSWVVNRRLYWDSYLPWHLSLEDGEVWWIGWVCRELWWRAHGPCNALRSDTFGVGLGFLDRNEAHTGFTSVAWIIGPQLKIAFVSRIIKVKKNRGRENTSTPSHVQCVHWGSVQCVHYQICVCYSWEHQTMTRLSDLLALWSM